MPECLNADSLRQAVLDVLGLEAVNREVQKLNTDPVAQREFKDRFAAAVGNEREMLASLTDNPRTGAWSWTGERLEVISKRHLQSTLSKVLGRVYHASPVVKNGLINRDKPSSQAVAPRKKLLAARLHNEFESELESSEG